MRQRTAVPPHAWSGMRRLGLAVLLLTAAGCTTTAASPATTVAATSTTLTASSAVPTGTGNDLKTNSAHHDLVIDGEKIRLKVDYWTTVDAGTWTAIGAKDVHLLAYVDPTTVTAPPQVVIDEFDAAFSLMAANPGLDGLAVDELQDRAGTAIPGFLITSVISYGSAFPTSGVSAPLAQRWAMLGSSAPLTEAALQRAGVYAVRVSFTYRVLVRSTGDASWHRRTVLDELTVPVKPVQVTTQPTPTG